MKKKEKYYLVEFNVYHYNSGRADNGTFTSKIKCKTLEEAIKTKKKVDLVYNTKDHNELDNDIKEWLYDEIMFYTVAGGFISSEAKVIAKYVVEIEVKIM